jgi:transcriptional regulator with XRE-family HTH domain
LKSCRARIDPAEHGLPASRRKPRAGLRREDAAALSGVSTSWYTWLEQGRSMRVSDDVLDRVASTLRMSEDERIYLFSLVQHRAPRMRQELPREVPVGMQRMLDALYVPALAMTLYWDVMAWNRMNALIFCDYAAFPETERNMLEGLLTRPMPHLTPAELESTARHMIGRLRFDYSRHADDPRCNRLVRRLEETSPMFRRMWRLPDFNLRNYGAHAMNHPKYGPLVFDQSSSVPDGYPYVRIILCTPFDAGTRLALERISASAEFNAG